MGPSAPSRHTAGEPATWLELARPLLLLIARQHVRTFADAEDAVQEATLRFWRYGRAAADDPKAYLVRCVKHAAMDLARAQEQRRRQEQAAGREPEAPLFECALEQRERRATLERALAGLPLEQREVLIMKVWGDLTFPQIAEALGIPANTAASRYRYGLTALRGRLGEGTGW